MSSPERSVRHGAVTAVVCLALAAVTAAMSSLNVALPDIARATQASQTQLSWIIDAYSLAFAVLLLPGGALGDRYGRKRMLLIGLAVFAAGSTAAMCVSSAGALIGLRGVIGVGAALIMPATLSTITGTFPPAQRAKAVSVWAAVAGAAAVLGVLLSGALLEVFHWEAVFGTNVVLAVIAIVGTLRVVPESADPGAPRLDIGGALLSVLGLVGVVYSVIEAPTAGWASARTILGISAGIFVLAVFVIYELRRKSPMLNPRVFSQRQLSAGSLSIFIQFFAFYGFMFLMLQYLQVVRHDSAMVAAVSLLPMAAGMIPSSRLAPRLVASLGSRAVCTAGLVVIAGALALLAFLDASTEYWVLATGLLLLGGGMGAAMTPATSSITSALPTSEQGVASAMNDLSREVGGALGIAVLGSIMTAIYRDNLTLPGLPHALADRARDSFAFAAHVGGDVLTQASNAFLDGLHIAYWTAAGAALLAAGAVIVLLPRRRHAGGKPEPVAATPLRDPAPEPVA